MDVKAGSTNPRKLIVWNTIKAALFFWPFLFTFHFVLGQPAPRALAIAAMQAASGLLAGICYQRISRRDGALAGFHMLMVTLVIRFPPNDTFSQELQFRAIAGAVYILMYCLLGLIFRCSSRPKKRYSASPLWDELLDTRSIPPSLSTPAR